MDSLKNTLRDISLLQPHYSPDNTEKMKQRGRLIRESLVAEIKSRKETLKNDSAEAADIKSKLEELNNAAMKLGEIMYKQNAQGQQTETGQETEAGKNADQKESKEENVVDADFEEVDEDSEKKSS